MREPKPVWSAVPAVVQAALADRLGSPVLEAAIAWGGYTPSASFIVTLANGKRVFIKGAHPGQNTYGVAAFKAEQQIYQNYPQLSGIAPAYICEVELADWHLMVLEAIEGGEKLLPWTKAKLEAVFLTLETLHKRIPAKPDGMNELATDPGMADLVSGRIGWRSLEQDNGFEQFYNKFADPLAAQAWFELLLPQLMELECQVASLGGRYQTLHVDLRSDNMLLRADGSAVLLDWPNLCWGPLVYDLTYFANSVVLEGYGTHEDVFALAGDVLQTGFERNDQLISMANMSGYFAASCIKPEVEMLPRLRGFQLQQLRAALPWMARLLKASPSPQAKGI